MKTILAFLAFCSFGLSANASAADLSAAIGATSQGGGTARTALGFNWDKSWMESSSGKITGYWDLGYTYWQAGDEAGGRHSISLSPVFVYELGQGQIKPFVEAGIGVAMFSSINAGDQKMSTAFNFEDRIGAGLKIGETQKVGIRAIHYSNGSAKEPNDGIESFSLFYSHSI